MTTTLTTTDRPARYGLAVGVDIELDRNARTAVDAYYADCNEFLAAESELQADWHTLAVDGLNMTVADLVERRDELKALRAYHEQTLTRLRWDFVEVLPKLLPSAKAAVANMQTCFDETLAGVIGVFAEQGITADSFSELAAKNPKAMQIQLTNKAKQEPVMLSVQSDLNRAKADLHVLESQLGVPVSPKRCCIQLPIPVDTHPDVAKLLS